MGRSDALRDKIQKLGAKQKLGALIKYADNPDDDVRMAVAIAMGLISTPSTARNMLRNLLSQIPILTLE